MFDTDDYNYLLQCDNIPEHPVFDATLEVRVYKFGDVLNRARLAQVIDQKSSVT